MNFPEEIQLQGAPKSLTIVSMRLAGEFGLETQIEEEFLGAVKSKEERGEGGALRLRPDMLPTQGSGS